MKSAVEKEWIEFAEAVMRDVPKDSVQYHEMQRAFSAGFLSALQALDKIAEIDDEEKAVEKLGNTVRQTVDYMKSLAQTEPPKPSGPQFPPRLIGVLGQGEDKKFYYEIRVAPFTGENAETVVTLGPFDTEKEAEDVGKKAIRHVVKEMETKAGGKPSSKYLDMKSGGVLRPWEEH